MCSFSHKERHAEGHPAPGTMQDSGDTGMKQVHIFCPWRAYRVLSRRPGTVFLDLDVEDHGDILDVDSRVFSM